MLTIRIRRMAMGAMLLVTAFGAAEVATRIDDWVRQGTPIMQTPDYDHDLRLRDWFGVRGRPHGQYRQWRLNNYGFRGPDIPLKVPQGCQRVMVLGASESFGLYESENREYPAQLRDSLGSHGCYEVDNAAIAGAGLKSIIRLWRYYASQLRPAVVVVYPSPSFYLGEHSPRWTPMPGRRVPDPDPPFKWRLLERIHEVWSTPDVLQRRRLSQWVAQDTADKPASWFFGDPPVGRLDAFMGDLDSLVTAIRITGATPVLVTHAVRFTASRDRADSLLLLSLFHSAPRARPNIQLHFERAAAEQIIGYGARKHVTVVDAYTALSEKRELFADFVHFDDEGAAKMAGLLTHAIIRVAPPSGLGNNVSDY